MHALLFSDVVDSTACVARLGDEAAAAMWAEHDRAARQLRAQHGGLEIDRSDGFFLLFETVADAVAFAQGYHAALDPLGLRARIGIHWGAVSLRRNTAEDVAAGAKPIEVEGLAKPLAARVMSLARGGQTLASAAAREALGDHAPEGTVVHDHGHYRAKGFDEPIEIVEIGPASAAFVPPADGDKIYRVVRRGDLWLPLRDVPHNLVSERDAFVGRTAELGRLAARWDAGARLVTLTGAGGSGKTRLACRYAHAWLGEWPGGVVFCDLSEARSLDGICFAVASALGVPLGSGDGVQRLGHVIAGHGRCLVILDNFEQVVAHAPATLGRWLDRAGEAGFLVTSRELLHLRGEEAMHVDSLDASEAMDLFVERARAHSAAFVLDDASRADVAAIVELLDGLPLGIELAAARVRVLSPAQIAVRLRDRFNMLRAPRAAAGAAARQATLEAAIDWSWQLLTPFEQAALAQCSVFDGGFTLEVAEAVLDLSAFADAPPVIDVVQSLVDKSLLRAWLPESGTRLDIAEPFFGMFLSIHDYAAGKLSSPDREAAEVRHIAFFGSLGRDEAIETVQHDATLRGRRLLALEIGNLIAACRRALRRGDGAAAAACFLAAWVVIEAQGPYGLGAALGEQVAAAEGASARQRALVLSAWATALRDVGRIGPARSVFEQALAAARDANDRRVLAQLLGRAATAHFREGAVDDAERCFVEALSLHRQTGHRGDEAITLANRANMLLEQGRMEEAREAYGTVLALHRESGHRAGEGISLGNLGTLHHEQGRRAEARAAYEAALAIHREAGSLVQQAITLGNLAQLCAEEGADGDALAHNEAALGILRRIGHRRSEGVVIGQIAALHHSRGEHAIARRWYEDALAIHREVGNRRFEGGDLGKLADLLATTGQPAAALPLFTQGERLLRDLGDGLELGKLLALKGRAQNAAGDANGARASLHEAERLCDELGAAPTSELALRVASLRSALGADEPGPR